jgi:hypothetical protein
LYWVPGLGPVARHGASCPTPTTQGFTAQAALHEFQTYIQGRSHARRRAYRPLRYGVQRVRGAFVALPRGGTRKLVAACICAMPPAEMVCWVGKTILASVWVTDAHAKLDLDLGTVPRGHGVRRAPHDPHRRRRNILRSASHRCLWQRHRAWSQAMARSAARALALCLATAVLLPGRTTGEPPARPPPGRAVACSAIGRCTQSTPCAALTLRRLLRLPRSEGRATGIALWRC